MAGYFNTDAAGNRLDAPDSYETMQRKRKLAEALMQEGTSTAPVGHWLQGLARMANAGVGAYKESQLDKQEKESGSQFSMKLLEALMPGGSAGLPPSTASASPASDPSSPNPAPSPAMASDGQPAPTPPANIPSSYRDAIAAIESKGSGDYAATGPVTNKGDRAFGRYQVMGANIPEWTKAALGKPMSPQEFLASPEAQDKVFDHRFGSYVQKYGNPQDAASAWFTGRPLAQGANSRDVLGTSGSAYVDKFTRALGQQPAGAAQAIAQAAPQQGSPAMAYAPTSGQPMDQPDPAALSPELLQDYARRNGSAPGAAPAPAPGEQPAATPMPGNGSTPASGAPAGRVDRPGDQLLKLGPNGELPPGAEKLLGALEGSPEARAMIASRQAVGGGSAGLRLASSPLPEGRDSSPASPTSAASQPAGSVSDRSRALLMMAMDPRYSPQQRQTAMQAVSTLQAQDKVSTVDLGSSIGIMDARGNIVRQIPKEAAPKWEKLNDGTLYDSRTGQTRAASGGPAFRALVDPAERARYGIPANDPKPYQIGADGKLTVVGGNGTSVNIDQKGESSFETEAGKKQADRLNTYIAGADKAQSMLGDIGQMREISRRIGSIGAGANLKAAIGPYAEAAGVNIEGLSDIQAFESVIQRIAPQMRAVGSGATSDIEFKGFLASLPRLSSNPQAREVILNTMEANANYNVKQGEIAAQVFNKEITRQEGEKQLRSLGDPMAAYREFRKSNPDAFNGAGAPASPGAASPAAAAPPAGMPQGARQAPDGNFYVPDPARPGKFLKVQ